MITTMKMVRSFQARQVENPYPFLAQAPCASVRAPRADLFGGKNRSLVLSDGMRTFYFELEAARNAFVKHYANVGAAVVTEDPLNEFA